MGPPPKKHVFIDAGPWPDVGVEIDPSLRLAVSLLGTGNAIQLFQQTGIQTVDSGHDKVAPQFLPLILELSVPVGEIDEKTLVAWRQDPLKLDVPDLYLAEGKQNPKLTFLTARMLLSDKAVNGDAREMQDAIVRVLRTKPIRNATLATMFQPALQRSCAAMDVPPDRVFHHKTLKGTGVVVGIVDDGCALAHWDFMKQRRPGTMPATRIQYLWDQTSVPKDGGVGWNPVSGSTGFDIGKAAIDSAIALYVGGVAGDVIDTPAVHDYLGYEIPGTASHGTHVMDIAAGNGQSLMGFPGVAPDADIVFVQLPADAIEAGGATLSDRILEGVTYIFQKASCLNKKCVVNVSYGGYAGPHDGTSAVETMIDQLLAVQNRAVIIAAGNGFEAHCHAHGRLTAENPTSARRWLLQAENPTLHTVEIWYNGDASLDVTIAPPDPSVRTVTAHLGDHLQIRRVSDNQPVGWVDHINSPTTNGDKCAVINLLPTMAAPPNVAAPPGTWTITLSLLGNVHAHYHAWIERDDAGNVKNASRLQSHFHEDDAFPGSTVTNLATGQLTVAVGAYNAASNEVCRYSACGPTRKTASGIAARLKPDVLAPAEELGGGGGVLCASSGGAEPTRMAGTSASAPQVAGLVALLFEFTALPLAASDVQHLLHAGALKRGLRVSRHQLVDVHQPVKQRHVWNDLIGYGHVDALRTI